MRRIILATLTTGFLLGGTHIVLSECLTFAQAKASNPTSHLAYHLVAGTQCWFAGYPAHRDLAVAKKKAKRVARLSKAHRSDESRPARALPDAGSTSERETVEPSSDRAENTQSENTQSENTQSISGIADAFNVVESDTNSVEASQWRVLGISDRAVEVSETRPPPLVVWLLVVWLLLTVAIGTTMTAIRKFHRYRRNARLVRHTQSWHRVRRIRMRDSPSAATPLVNHVDIRILDP